MKHTKIAIMLILISTAQIGIGQDVQDLFGRWKFSPLKVLTLNTDHTFAYKKGAFNYEGSYSMSTKYGDKYLIMDFAEKKIEYLIVDFSGSTMELIETPSKKTLQAKILEKFDVESEEVLAIPEKDLESHANHVVQDIQDQKTGLFKEDAFKPESPWIVSLFAGASLNFISNPSLIENSFSYNNVDRSIKYKEELGYQGGINAAYEVVQGFYLGSGLSVTKLSFSEIINLYQAENINATDLNVTQKTKYSMYGLQVPLTAHISISDKFKIEIKGIGSKFFKSTSKENTSLIGSYLEKPTNEEIVYYEDNQTVSYEEGVELFSFGYGVELQYFFAKHLGISLFYNKNHNYFKFEQKELDGRNIGTNLILKF